MTRSRAVLLAALPRCDQRRQAQGKGAAVSRYTYHPNDDEAAVAGLIAKRRNTLNFGGSNLPGGETATVLDRYVQHYRAALAEVTVARIFNLCWTGCGKGSDGAFDVGSWLEVRSVAQETHGLLVRSKDLAKGEETPYVLVLVTNDRMCRCVGWSTVRHVKAAGWLKDPQSDSPCWILPAAKLSPMSNLEFWHSLEQREMFQEARV